MSNCSGPPLLDYNNTSKLVEHGTLENNIGILDSS